MKNKVSRVLVETVPSAFCQGWMLVFSCSSNCCVCFVQRDCVCVYEPDEVRSVLLNKQHLSQTTVSNSQRLRYLFTSVFVRWRGGPPHRSGRTQMSGLASVSSSAMLIIFHQLRHSSRPNPTRRPRSDHLDTAPSLSCRSGCRCARSACGGVELTRGLTAGTR